MRPAPAGAEKNTRNVAWIKTRLKPVQMLLRKKKCLRIFPKMMLKPRLKYNTCPCNSSVECSHIMEAIISITHIRHCQTGMIQACDHHIFQPGSSVPFDEIPLHFFHKASSTLHLRHLTDIERHHMKQIISADRSTFTLKITSLYGKFQIS